MNLIHYLSAGSLFWIVGIAFLIKSSDGVRAAWLAVVFLSVGTYFNFYPPEPSDTKPVKDQCVLQQKMGKVCTIPPVVV